MVVLGGLAFSYERGNPVGRPLRHASNTGNVYRGTSLTRKRTPLGPYRRPMPRILGGLGGVGVFLWARHPCTASISDHKKHYFFQQTYPQPFPADNSRICIFFVCWTVCLFAVQQTIHLFAFFLFAGILERVPSRECKRGLFACGVVNICIRIGCSNPASGLTWGGMAPDAMKVTTQRLHVGFK